MYTQTPSGALAVERRILMHDVVYNADAASPAASIFSNIHIHDCYVEVGMRYES